MANLLADTIQTDFLNCAICFEHYRDPRTVPCQHSFCRECLEQSVASSEDKHTLICPTCRREINISTEEVTQLPVYVLVSSLNDTVDLEQQVQIPCPVTLCSNCDDSNSNAVVRCMECKDYLCDICHASHKNLKAMRNHKVVTMADILSGKVNLSAEEENICYEHGEPYKYYCKDEKKLICQDCVSLKICPIEHDLITIDEAAQNQSYMLQGLVKKGSETLKKFQEAVKAINDVENKLKTRTKIAKDALAKVEHEKINLAKNTVKRFKDEIEKINRERITELEKQKADLESIMNNIQRANEEATNIIKNESNLEVIYSHSYLSSWLKKLTNSQPVTANKELSYVRFDAATPTIPTIGQLLKDETQGNRWKLIGQFITGEFNILLGLALDQDDNIVVCSWGKGVKVFSTNGQVKPTLYDSPGSICVGLLPDNMYVTAPRGTQQVRICDSQGSQTTTITIPITNVDNTPSHANSLTVDTANNIIVGQVLNTISIYNTDGSLISKFATKYEPYRLAATSNKEIVCSFYDRKLNQGICVQLMDYFGGNVRVIQPPSEVKVSWSPGFVCCKQQEIFVCNECSGDPTGVYRYTSDGDYLGCVTTEVDTPKGLALSNDGIKLFVAERYDNCVKIFKRP